MMTLLVLATLSQPPTRDDLDFVEVVEDWVVDTGTVRRYDQIFSSRIAGLLADLGCPNAGCREAAFAVLSECDDGRVFLWGMRSADREVAWRSECLYRLYCERMGVAYLDWWRVDQRARFQQTAARRILEVFVRGEEAPPFDAGMMPVPPELPPAFEAVPAAVLDHGG